jgi:hypothetical protein
VGGLSYPHVSTTFPEESIYRALESLPRRTGGAVAADNCHDNRDKPDAISIAPVIVDTYHDLDYAGHCAAA